MKIAFLKVCFIALTLSSCSQLSNIQSQLPPLPGTGLTNTDVVNGLKKALEVGTDTSVKRLSGVNGFLGDQAVKILLPPESQEAIARLRQLPVTKDLVDQTITAINRAAEDAAREAAPIFKDAIRNMTISDAMGILKGSDTSATHYLRNATYQSLWAAFLPKINASLGKPLVLNESAEGLYAKLINTYNKASLNGALFEQIKTNSLSEYVTGKALEGVFIKVAEEENNIRNKADHQVTDLLRKVFGK
jgi:hypothetical protein